MPKSLKLILSALLLISVVQADAQSRPATTQPAAWDGATLLAKAEQSLKALPAKEAETLRALLTSTGPSRYDDRASAWIKTSTKDDLKPVADYAVASLRAMAEAGDAEGMYFLHFVLTHADRDRGRGLPVAGKSSQAGLPSRGLRCDEAAVEGPAGETPRRDGRFFQAEAMTPGLQALYWFAYGYEKGQDGLPKDTAKAAEYRARSDELREKLNQGRKGQK